MARSDVTVAAAGRPVALRALLWFWAGLAVVTVAGGATLQVLGPPPGHAPGAEVPPPPATPPPAELARAAPPAPPAALGVPATTAAASQASMSHAAVAAPAPAVSFAAPRAPGSPIAPPIAALLEPSGLAEGGMLPRVGPGGLAPMRAYAAGAPPLDARPRVAILLADFAMREADSEEVLRVLPVAVSLVVSPYAGRTGPLVEQARQAGRELWLSLPMEPKQFPLDDPGNRALLTGAAPAQNMATLRWVLSRQAGYVGTTGALGSLRGERFAAAGQMGAVLEELGRRGLMYVDPRVDGQLPPPVPGAMAPRRAVDVVIDEPAVRTEIESRLERLEQVARDRGSALGLASAPVPVTVERLAAWSSLLAQRGVLLVPVSALLLPAQ